jgi:uncharacterized protein YlxW (UPF0749 family)
MAAWLIPALKLVLPHVGTIFSAAAPVFTKKKPDEALSQSALLQQQVTELQTAASQNAAHIKELAEALEKAAEIADAKLRRAFILCAAALLASAAALGVALFVLFSR